MKKLLLFIAIFVMSLSFTQNIIAQVSLTVNTQGMTFVPQSVTITAGDNVTFINTGGFHNVNGSLASFPGNPQGFANVGGVVGPGVMLSNFVFGIPGTYNYQCDPHIPGMVGTIIVQPSSSPTITSIIPTNPLCYLDINGSATVNINQSNPPIDLAVKLFWQNPSSGFWVNLGNSFSNSPAYILTHTFVALGTGAYRVDLVDDATGVLIEDDFFTLVNPNPININLITKENISCFGSADGSIDITVTGGTQNTTLPLYNYSWLNTLIGFSSNTEDLLNINQGGTYSLNVTDANSCPSSVFIVNITEPTALSALAVSGSITCFGASDGMISLLAGGGNPPYTISWLGPNAYSSIQNANPSNITQLNTGNYDYTITDSKGCLLQSISPIYISEPNLLFVNAFSTDISCFGYCDGSAFSMPSGGTPPYSYLWSNGNIADNISALCEGAYVVNITDANNCVNIETVVISEPLTLVSSNTINGCDSVLIGSNYYTISGAYTDTLTSVNGCDSVVNTNLTIGQNTSSYDTLSVGASIVWNGMPLNVSGDYSVTLINSVGCDSIVNLNLTITTTGISDIPNNKSNLVKITDMLGQETPYRRNTPLFYIYDDGTVEKRIVIE